MATRKYPTTEDNTCSNPENHPTHMCQLKMAGRTDDIRRRSDRPAFACFNCGARANEAGDLCSPTPLASD